MFYVHIRALSTPTIDMTGKITVSLKFIRISGTAEDDRSTTLNQRGPLMFEQLIELINELLKEWHVTLSPVVERFLGLPEGIPLIKGMRITITEEGPLMVGLPSRIVF